MENNNQEFRIKFRGIRGSHPVCSKNQTEFGGNTACVEVLVNGRYIVLDAGSGIINLGNDLVRDYIASGSDPLTRTPMEITILTSHAHLDHIQGLPFFKPAYIKSSKINLFGMRAKNTDFEQILSEAIFSHIFPLELKEMSANLSIKNVYETEALILRPGEKKPEIIRISDEKEIEEPNDTIIITCSKSYAHPKDGVMLYKISCNGRSIVYATDKESYIGGDSKLATFARNTDLLIHDAQYTYEDYISPVTPKQGFGHCTPEMAIEAAKMANAKQLVLYHLDPSYDDEDLKKMEERAKKSFKNVIVAREDMIIDLMQIKCGR